jgi:hypothetical protein
LCETVGGFTNFLLKKFWAKTDGEGWGVDIKNFAEHEVPELMNNDEEAKSDD